MRRLLALLCAASLSLALAPAAPVQGAVPSTIVGWGLNASGQAAAPAGEDFVAIAAGDLHSLALRGDGSLVDWGDNTYGQLTTPAGDDFVAIAAGCFHSLALRGDGSIVGWGRNDYGESTPPAGNDFIAIAAGPGCHSLALRSDGSIVGWGHDVWGEATPPEGSDYIAIAVGNRHSLALRSDGSIVGWGRDINGESTPPEGNDFVAIAAGDIHSLALRSDGSIAAWGLNDYGQATPPEGNDFVAIAAAGDYGLALRSDGSIAGWGLNSDGQTTPPTNHYLAIAAGGSHGLALIAPPVHYADITFPTDSNMHETGGWDLNACDATLSYTVDASGITQTAPWNTSYTEVGLREVGAGDFNPGPWNTYQGGKGGWMGSLVGDLTPSPTVGTLMDKLNLSASGGRGEGDYDVYSATPGIVESPTIGSGSNHGIWFDRDGIDPYQVGNPLNVDGDTYNTGGVYDVVIRYHAISSGLGSMVATVNGIPTSFGPYPNYGDPAGLSFKGSMTAMQFFAGYWTPADAGGQVSLSNISITGCRNVAPDVTITAPAAGALYALGAGTSVAASFTDADEFDTHTCSIDWDDGTTSVGTVVEANGIGTCAAGPHVYGAPGVYNIAVAVTDEVGNAGTADVMVIAYDPAGGFVTGGGWIMSPAGAYVADPTLEGRATFGFVSKYKKGATVPDGNTEFQFRAGDLNFSSTSYQWLVVSKAGMNAQFKGTGTVNGTGAYGFMIWATDRTPDTFRIKIWDTSAGDAVVYDNGVEQTLGSGSIVVHVK